MLPRSSECYHVVFLQYKALILNLNLIRPFLMLHRAIECRLMENNNMIWQQKSIS